MFSFVFGSCNVSSRVPYVGTALEAAAAMEPDFVVHLGDYCYPDSGAYRQSVQGYLALWTDLLYEECLGRLFSRPWIYVASDHDLGGNNVDSETLSPFAQEAYTTWHRNGTGADGEGRYGAIEFDEGRVLFIWVDAISLRSPIAQPDGPDKTSLGAVQKKWLLSMLANSSAGLIIIASQTTFGHDTDTGWGQYATERLEVLEACQQVEGIVRWISGDHHSARWVRIGDKIAEWGAAPFAEVPQSCLGAATFVDEQVCISRMALSTSDAALSRSEVLARLARDEINASTSFGRVVIDTIQKTATFEVRDSTGQVRIHDSGFRMMETIKYL